MIYPKFLKPGDTIGICASSDGIDPNDTKFDVGINYLKKEYKIVETEHVRTGLFPASDAKTRAKEFNELMKRDDIDLIYSAAGGDFLIEILPYIDTEIIEEKIVSGKTKFYVGYSDPSSLIYYLTTRFDIATIYGTNASSFARIPLNKCLQDALSILKGNIVFQNSFEKCERLSFEELVANGINDYAVNTNVNWITPNGDVDLVGRIIGGLIDSIRLLLGTPYDYTTNFIEKYKNDGIIWFFDIFSLRSDDLYYTLWQMKQAGWFKYAKGFVFGRVMISGERDSFTYLDAVKRALGEEIPIIMDADIGHVRPTFNVINGAIGHFKSSGGKGSLEMALK